MSLDPNWIDMAVKAARPRVVAALLRYFGSVELAEEAFQEACLKALGKWPDQGPPRDPASWLVVVGRNAGLDRVRRAARETSLPEEIAAADENTEEVIAHALDDAPYGDDILRLLFICCHRDLPATQQIALALRVVSGLSVGEIARAFLVRESAMEQRLTRAKRTVGQADVPFETPSPLVRAERLATVSAMIYLTFNEGYAAAAWEARRTMPLCAEAIRLGRLLLRLFPEEAEVHGLLALMLLQHSRVAARFDDAGAIVLLEDQDRRLWDRAAILEGTALTDRAFRARRPGPYQLQAAIAALHARAASFEQTDWVQIERLYGVLFEFQPTPVVALNHAVAISYVRHIEEALGLVERLSGPLAGYFYYHAVRGHLLERMGRTGEARQAYAVSLGLARSAAEAAQMRIYIDRLKQKP